MLPKLPKSTGSVMVFTFICMCFTAVASVVLVISLLFTRQKLLSVTGAVLKTSFGDITIRFESTPSQARDNFIRLSQVDFYHNLRFHRVVDNFAIQTGDPLSRDLSAVSRWGSGGPGYSFPLEASVSDQLSTGSVVMVRENTESHGSQFMILVDDIPWLAGQNSKFASVTEGMEIAKAISHLSTGPTNIPAQEVWLLDIILK